MTEKQTSSSGRFLNMSRKKRIVSAIAGFVCLVVLAGILIGVGFHSRKKDESSEIEYSTFILGHDEDEHDLEVLKERLQDNLDPEDYILSERGDKIQLSFRTQLAEEAEMDPDSFLNSFLIREGNCFFCSRTYYGHPLYELTAADIVDIEWYEENISEGGADESAEETTEDSGEEAVHVIRFSDSSEETEIAEVYCGITCSDSVMEFLQQRNAEQETVYLRCGNWLFDVVMTNPFTGESLDNTFYLKYDLNADSETAKKLFICNLTHDVINGSFTYDDITETENLQWAGARDHRCDGSQITEDYYTFQYVLRSGENIRISGSMKEELTEFWSSRLDCLETEYAIGFDDHGTVQIRIKAEKINKQLMEALIRKSDFNIRSQLYSYNTWSIDGYTEQADKDQLSLFCDEDLSEDIAVFQEEYNTNYQYMINSDLYLCLGDYPLIICRSWSADDKELKFSALCYSDGAIMKQTRDEFLKLIKVCMADGSDLASSYSLDYYCYEDREYYCSEYFGLPVPYLYDTEDLQQKLEEICPGIQVKSDLDELTFELNLPVDDQIIDRVFELVPKLYEVTGFEKSFYKSLRVNITEMKGNEHAVLRFSKNMVKNVDEDVSTCHIYFDGNIAGGRFLGLDDEVKAHLDTDTFFVNFTEPDETVYEAWCLEDN